ncbi:MAG TPA: diguanylate cyclase, partial [Anaeromyxobacteraceae bacterium]|nr:diguanylate cyclase [Anaeromyxobacteraceae bacterium]
MLHLIDRSIGRKLLAAVGLPSLAVALAGVLWLRHEARLAAPSLEPTFGVAVVGLLVFAGVMGLIHAVAVRVLLENPLRQLTAAMRRAREGDFLHRVEVAGDDELAELARTFNTTLAAITDLHALRIDDATLLASMQREVALKAQVEARVRELELLHRLAEALAATLDLDQLAKRVAELASERLPGISFALLLAEESTGDLVVRGAAGVDAAAVGTRLVHGAGLAGQALASKRLTRADDAPAGAIPGAGPLGTVVAIPLLHPAGCAGVLLYGRPERDAFGEEELRLLESAARQVATAVENVRLHLTMVRLSQTDTLTGVQNRRQLFARLELERERAVRFGEPFALLLVDVDRFRELNEAVGHAAGDAVLRDVATILAREVRAVDLVARYGGEEFAVVLPRIGPAEAQETAERLRAAVAGARFEAAPGGKVTISLGGASFPDDARELA